MSELCRRFCPAYQECQNRISHIIQAQRRLHDFRRRQGLGYDPTIIAPGITLPSFYTDALPESVMQVEYAHPVDPLLRVAESALAISSAERHCSGPRMNFQGNLVWAIGKAARYLSLKRDYFDGPDVTAALHQQTSWCTSEIAIEALAEMPYFVPPRA